jgi:hypothetical protein
LLSSILLQHKRSDIQLLRTKAVRRAKEQNDFKSKQVLDCACNHFKRIPFTVYYDVEQGCKITGLEDTFCGEQ